MTQTTSTTTVNPNKSSSGSLLEAISTTAAVPAAAIQALDESSTASSESLMRQYTTAAQLQPTVEQVVVATLNGRVFDDKNADDLQESDEGGIASANVQLVRDANGDGVISSNEVLVSTTTDANGNYSFQGLTPGEGYQVRFLTPTGYDDSFSLTLTDPTTLQAGAANRSVDAGFFKYASLGDRVWDDTNGNGIQDTGEKGHAGVTVQLHSVYYAPVGVGGGGSSADVAMVGDLLATQKTDANGSYKFTGLAPGEYVLQFVAPDGTVLSKADVGVNDTTDSDAGLGGFTGVYKLASGENNTSADAGLKSLVVTKLAADSAVVAEDRSVTFNVLSNDVGAGLKLVGVAHETSSLDKLFKFDSGALSFTADGKVTYKSMTDYYGYDKLVYTVEDATGARYTQTVDVNIKAVSDAPDAIGGKGSVIKITTDSTVLSNVYYKGAFSMTNFSWFDDSKDELQTFGTYNKDRGVKDDVDVAKYVRIYDVDLSSAKVFYKGSQLSFGGSKYYDISIADVKAGKLEMSFTGFLKDAFVKWAWVDSGAIKNDAGYDGSIVSKTNWEAGLLGASPIALDLNGDGHIGVTGATSSSQKDASATLGHTVQFDMDADGKLDTTEWFDGSGDGILVDNRDGLAALHMDASRLFGDADGYAHGYDKLATLDLNGDGLVSGEEMKGLLVWVDNGDAQVQDGELRTLGEVGIASISTQVNVTVDAEGRGHLESTATREDGTQVMSEDVYFAHIADAPALDQVIGGNDSALDSLVGHQVALTTTVNAESTDVADVSQAAELLRKLAAAIEGQAVAA